MRSRSLAAQHDAAVARRLELLTSELAAVRERRPTVDTRTRPVAPGSPPVRGHIQVVPDLDAADEPTEAFSAPAPSVARVPGRHASRRTALDGSWSVVPEGLRGRIALGPGHVAVVAVAVAVGLALTCWWLLRSGGREVAAPGALSTPGAALATPVGGASAPGATDSENASGVSHGSATGVGPTSAARARVVVDVTGKVRRPGIVVLRQGARVVDALHAAGGARPGVDLAGLNLARVLSDGEQVVVGGSPTVAVPPGAGSAAASGSPVTGLVNINTADETTLESLPEVGPVTAQAIITWRTQHGGYTSVDQLLDVDGIGDATLAKLTPFVTI